MINPFKWFRRELSLEAKLPDKDPNDFRLSSSSSIWYTDTYCPTCYKSTSHEERMARICNGCGTYDKQLLYAQRAYRKIVKNGKWIWQYKYEDGKSRFSE